MQPERSSLSAAFSTPGLSAADQFQLRRYDPTHAVVVAEWPADARELLWVAPGTPPPLTPARVEAWGAESHERFVAWDPAACVPAAYGELNELTYAPDQLWIGHVLVEPRRRRRGIGAAFMRSLLDVGFGRSWVRRVLLLVIPDNGTAIRCYERLGFEVEAYERKHFAQTDRDLTFLRMVIERRRFEVLQVQRRLPRPLSAAAGGVV